MSRDRTEITEYINQCKALGSTYGLTAIKALLACLGDPQDKLPVVHVAGTNGKGSICAFTANIISQAGYKCGVYTSPQVFSFYERYRIDSVDIAENRFLEVQADVVSTAIDNGIQVSLFELETVIAYVYFLTERCDIALMEAGCGGLLDATNVTSHPVAVCFASIGMDHMQLLGDTVAKIAANKAGLIKDGAIVVSAPQSKEAGDALDEKAYACHTFVEYADESQLSENGQLLTYKGISYQLNTPGSYQKINSITAIELVKALHVNRVLNIQDADIAVGIPNARMPGRFEKIADSVYIDGAHNEPAILMLKKTLLSNFTNASFTFIIGVLNDKAYADYLPLIIDLADAIITISTVGDRGLSADDLAACIRRFYKGKTEAVCDIRSAAERAKEEAAKGRIVVFFGSLSRLDAFKRIYIEDNKNG